MPNKALAHLHFDGDVLIDNSTSVNRSTSLDFVLQHNPMVQIATLTSRHDKKIQNKSLSLTDFIKLIGTPVRTHETSLEFSNMLKPKQGDLKDVGGFIGGSVKGGRRVKSAIANRSIVTLDADFADEKFLDAVNNKLKDYCYSIYSTRSHNEVVSRYRLLIYTDEIMTPDEYVAISRMIANRVGIDYFDDTTYDTNRLMYYPSTSADGVFFFYHNDKPKIAKEFILNSYKVFGDLDSWKDIFNHPRSSREEERTQQKFSTALVQQDPLDKDNVIGAFCRTFSITEAIEEFLPTVYTRSGDDRFTFVGASTSNGLVIYEDKFAFSNHSTDPASGITCNAFDLVRIHKFGALDAERDDGILTSKLPSFSEMTAFASNIEPVRKDMVERKISANDSNAMTTEQLMTMFGDSYIDVEELNENNLLNDVSGDGSETTDTSWITKLQMSPTGLVKPTSHNLALILCNDINITQKLMFNTFNQRLEWGKGVHADEMSHLVNLKFYVSSKYGIELGKDKFYDAIYYASNLNAYHPVQDYLNGLVGKWDGVPRAETMLIDWCGVKDSAYTRAVSRTVLNGALARAFVAGTKFDTIPVLEGRQGIGKSTFVQLLAGKKDWFGELMTFDHQKAVEQTMGKWIIELGEMVASRKSDISQQKQFISSSVDNVRLAYRRDSVEHRRAFIMISTTNDREYLTDPSGNRRWLPLLCNFSKGEEIDLFGFAKVVDQIWAEVVEQIIDEQQLVDVRKVDDLELILTGEARELAHGMQESRVMVDEWQGVIELFLESKVHKERYSPDFAESFEFDTIESSPELFEKRTQICIAELKGECLGISQNSRSPRAESNRIVSILNNLGWMNDGESVRFGEYGKQKSYELTVFKSVEYDF